MIRLLYFFLFPSRHSLGIGALKGNRDYLVKVSFLAVALFLSWAILRQFLDTWPYYLFLILSLEVFELLNDGLAKACLKRQQRES